MKKTAVLGWAVVLSIVLFYVAPALAYVEPVDGPPPPSITKFIDPLPQPPIRTPSGTYKGAAKYDVYLKAAKAKIHSQLDSTPVFTFDGLYPGPTFLVQSGGEIDRHHSHESGRDADGRREGPARSRRRRQRGHL